jgi:hypothetical protein
VYEGTMDPLIIEALALRDAYKALEEPRWRPIGD